MSTRRALHFVFKVGNRTETARFYRDVLGMKFLRHEEFEKGCEAACNGPYDGKWSKSMVGYGPEDNHFVVELTYNYGIGTYRLGTDFRGINIYSKEAFKKAVNCGLAVIEDGGKRVVKSPDGYSFVLEDKECQGDPVQSVCLGCSDLSKSVDFWSRLCGMKIYRQEDKSALLGFGDNQCKLELQDIGTSVDHATAFGRIAFSCPRTELPDIERKMKEAEQTILTPLISLDTPGKATVEVVILADPDGHEICFVGDEAFRELSQVDDKADGLLDQGIAADKSEEWFKKKGLSKGTA
ncbi:glyoxalase domain-containing protein 4-like isoform X1 [Mizuhopecten yessoensis]|uniref:glyoxalase domain-containing protein 4-like isoform X1 n=1 Tax=Mizuhopecten yessoensis TaxID=6573 RepID=UPI000B4579B3|nr:glyoxalase domain-containing protein 4-like isoform X1 [Mizuhopecten yessoensis]